MSASVVWLACDPRHADDAALLVAAEAGRGVALYVFEPALLAAPEVDAAHVRFVLGCVAELRSALRVRVGRLLVRVGQMPQVLDRLHLALRFGILRSHAELGTRDTWERDTRGARWCRMRAMLVGFASAHLWLP